MLQNRFCARLLGGLAMGMLGTVLTWGAVTVNKLDVAVLNKQDIIAGPVKNALPERVDAGGMPLPPGAVARLGTTKYKSLNLCLSLAASPSGKYLAGYGVDRDFFVYDTTTGHQILHKYNNPQEPWKEFSATGSFPCFSPDDSKVYLLGSECPSLEDGSRKYFSYVLSCIDLRTRTYLWARQYILPEVPAEDTDTTIWSLTQIRCHPDGKSLVISGAALFVVDALTGNMIKEIRVENKPVNGMACFSPDGKKLSVANYSSILSFDTKNYAPLAALNTIAAEILNNQPQQMLFNAEYSPDGKMISLATSLTEAIVINADTGKLVWRKKLTKQIAPLCTRWTADGKTLAVRTQANVEVFDAADGTLRWAKDALHYYEWTRFSPQLEVNLPNHELALSLADVNISIYDLDTGKQKYLVDDMKLPLSSVFAVSQNPTLMVSTSTEGQLLFWNYDKPRVVGRIYTHRQTQSNGSISPDGSLLATVTESNKLYLWDTINRKRLGANDLDPAAEAIRDSSINPTKTQAAFTIRVQEEEGQVVRDKLRVLLVDISDLKKRKVVNKIASQVYATACTYTRDGKYLVTAGYGLSVIDPQTGEETLVADKIGDSDQRWGSMIYRVEMARDNRVVLATGEHNLDAIELATGQKLWTYTHTKHDYKDFTNVHTSVSACGRFVALSNNEKVEVLDLAIGKPIMQYQGHLGLISMVQFTRDSRTFVSVGNDGVANVWSLDPYEQIKAEGKPVDTTFVAGKIWGELTDSDPVKSWRAVWKMVYNPEVAIAWLDKNLELDNKDTEIVKLIRQLDDDDFNIREAASRELGALGRVAEPALRQALTGKPSFEVKARINDLLSQAGADLARGPKEMGTLRAICALEFMNHDGAKALLAKWAGGAAGARLTMDAKAALDRIEGRQAVTPTIQPRATTKPAATQPKKQGP